MCSIDVLLCGNINTIASRFVDKMAVCLFFYPQTINIKWLFVDMPGNKQSIRKWLDHVRQLGHVL